jgi:hypothetical protein
VDGRLVVSCEAGHRHEVLLLARPQLQILLSQETPLEGYSLSPNKPSQQIVLLGVCLGLYLAHLLETGHFIVRVAAKQLAVDMVVLAANFDHGVPHIIIEVVSGL